ncbi:MAG: hypothetical protein PHX48_03345 [Bacteroidales bacterium]|nr:hypothetical protein [Bacteroidales bacterium]
MKRFFCTLLIITICITTNILFAQGKKLKVEVENISIKMPEHWLIQKTEKKMLDFTIRLFNEKNNNQVKIHCIKKALNEESAIINASSEKSLKPGYEYMIIEKVKTQNLNKYKGKFVEYTNSPLRDYYRGGFYGIIDNGYTYIIEYYSADTPEDRAEVATILKTLNILKPESRPNFFEIEKEYLQENVVIEKPQDPIEIEDIIEEITPEAPKQAPIAEINDQPKTEKKSIWNKITSIFKKKDKN